MFSDNEAVRQLIMYCTSGLIGTLGFVILYRIRWKRLPVAVIGGTLTVFVWFTVSYYIDSLFVPNFIASIFATLYSEIMARITKAPATVYMVPSVIPLVPGSRLYYTMEALVRSDNEGFRSYAVETGEVALGIAVGIVIVSIAFNYVRMHRKYKIPKIRI